MRSSCFWEERPEKRLRPLAVRRVSFLCAAEARRCRLWLSVQVGLLSRSLVVGSEAMTAPLVVLEFLSLSFVELFWSIVAQVSVAGRRLHP